MRKAGFSVLEYSLMLIIIVAAFLTMQVYLKRAVAGKWKSSIDAIGYGRQY